MPVHHSTLALAAFPATDRDSMSSLDRFVPRVSRRTLLVLAGALWSFAGFKLISIGIADIVVSPLPLWVKVVGALVVGWLFVRYIFGPMYFRHRLRIMLKEPERAPFHRFFDLRSYLIAIVMMSMGILLRRSGWIDPDYLSVFYMGLGPALLAGGLFFLKGAVVYDRVRAKITAEDRDDSGGRESLPHIMRRKAAPDGER